MFIRSLSSTLRVPAHLHQARKCAVFALTACLGLLGAGAALAAQATLSVNNSSVTEGNSGTSNLNFDVVRGGDMSSNIVVPYSLTPGSATAGSDYVASSAGSVVRIPAGQIHGVIGVPVIGDTTLEPNETLTLNLGVPAAFDPMAGLAAARAYGVGTAADAVAIGDFNGDGRRDLAVPDRSGNRVSILLGNGSGGFGAATSFAVGNSPIALAIGDFNGDGKPDLAVVNLGSNNVSILLGNGSGGFGAAANYAVGTSPNAIAVGDFNGDGRLDLAVTKAGFGGDNNVSVLLGNGSGGFGAAVSFSAGNNPSAVAVGDFDGDGKPDLAVANYTSNNVSILRNQGGGTFAAAVNYAVGTRPGAIAVGDFNGDGKRDLAVTNFSSNSVTVLIGNGGGGFALTSFAGGNAPDALAIGDVDGDGKLDLVLANGNDTSVSILRGNGSGGFAAAYNVSVGDFPLALALGDFNADGMLDLALAFGGPNVVVALGNGSATTFDVAQSYATDEDPAIVVAAGFNTDGRPDLATLNEINNTLSVLLNNGSGGFGAAITTSLGLGSDSLDALAVGDFNRDGLQDVAVADFSASKVAILLGNGSGGFGAATSFAVGTHPTAVAVGDFNGDGKPDLAVANYDGLNVSILLGNGSGGFGAATNFATGSGPYALAIADFNGDGKLDLAVANSNSNSVSILLGNGSGGFSAAANYTVGSAPYSVAVGDFNGDGKLDLAVVNTSSDNVSILRGDGSGAFGPAVNYAVGDSPQSLVVGDFNGDGKLDLAVANLDSANLAILRGDGSGAFGAADFYATGSGPSSVAVRDFNVDGKPDLAFANAYSNNVSVLINAPTSTVVRLNISATGTIIDDDADTTPNAFAFTDATNVALSSVQTSNAITVAGINTAAQVTVTGGSYSIGCGATFVSTAGTISNGQSVCVRHTAAAAFSTATNTTLTIGGVSDTFTSTTLAVDTTPDAFTLTDLTTPAGTSTRSNTIIVSGITVAVPLVLSGPGTASPQYSINGGKFKYYNTGDGQPMVNNGDTVQLRAISSQASGTVDMVLSVGSYSDTWTLTTPAVSETPNAFDFKDKTNQPANRFIGSGGVRISGINSPVSISISGDPSAGFRINNGAYIAGPAMVSNGDLVVLRLKSAATLGSEVSAVVSIGGVTDRWTVTTAP